MTKTSKVPLIMKRLLHKWLAGIVSSPLMALGSGIVLFGIQYEDFWGVFLFGTILLGIIYSVLGVPLSFLIDWIGAAISVRQKWVSLMLHILAYAAGGFAASMIFFAIADSEHIDELFDYRMLILHLTGSVGAIVFLSIERVIRNVN